MNNILINLLIIAIFLPLQIYSSFSAPIAQFKTIFEAVVVCSPEDKIKISKYRLMDFQEKYRTKYQSSPGVFFHIVPSFENLEDAQLVSGLLLLNYMGIKDAPLAKNLSKPFEEYTVLSIKAVSVPGQNVILTDHQAQLLLANSTVIGKSFELVDKKENQAHTGFILIVQNKSTPDFYIKQAIEHLDTVLNPAFDSGISAKKFDL
jgi:hypothetical protein